jgi:glutamine synthetase
VVRYTAEKNIALFQRHGIFTESEAKAREHIALDEYCNTIKIEAATMLEMYNRQIFPSILRIEKEFTQVINEKNQLKVSTEVEMIYLNKISDAIIKTNELKTKLSDGLIKFMTIDNLLERAKFCCDEILILMKELRLYCDRLESRMPKRL